MVQVGLEVFLEKHITGYAGCRIGYLSNHASTDRNFIQGRILLRERLGRDLTCLFSPQHGFFAEQQDNMIESAHSVDSVTGLPVFSLYGEHRKPTAEMFDQLDILLFDLVDVGTRVYTFMYTMAYCLQSAAEFGKKVIILDRPNPIGGEAVEGNILQSDYTSFVGLYPVPMRHGMTLGELALMMNKAFGIGADLDVITMEGWKRKYYMDDVNFPWLAPSPNMPTLNTAIVYPGQVIWEGTMVSEGRGTTMPFELVGAPYWQHGEIEKYLQKTSLPGCYLRPVVFQPTSGKYAEQPCSGFHIHVINKAEFRPYRTSLALLQAVMNLYGDDFEYKQPPYEYEFDKLPMDMILGDKKLRIALENEVPVIELEKEWGGQLQEFIAMRSEYLLYT